MVDISDAEMERWFNEEFLPNHPEVRDRWDSFSDERKAARIRSEIAKERTRRTE